jgi:hexosaminidase
MKFAAACCLIVLPHAILAQPLLMPIPANVGLRPGHLAIASSFKVLADPRLHASTERFLARLAGQTGLPIVPGPTPTLTVECRDPGPAYPTLGEDESYVLDIDDRGARLAAPTFTGVQRGLETFLQLVVPGAGGFEAPAIHIDDKPRFPWRGIMLDVSRHWMPVPVIERNLDAMAAVKMNVFHWHLADDQGFRVESMRFPKLQQLASDGHFYTQTEVRHIVEYARERRIRVVPEFDMPGHSTALLAAYPEFASAPGPYTIERTWGIFQPTLDPTREETYTFLDSLIGEMASLFADPYFHIGGDEVDDTQWKNSASIQAFAKQHNLATSDDLQAWFNSRVQRIVAKYGKTTVGWDEVLHPGLAPGTVIQSWRGQDALAVAARKGFRGLLSFGYYLDHLQPTSFHYANDPLTGATASLDAEAAQRILGGEACMWTEYTSAETVDSRIWPRAAAIAERLWSPAGATDPASMYARMERVSRLLDWTGVKHRTDYLPQLERLTGGAPTGGLQALADVSEATGIEVRRDARKYTSLVPLNRFVDAVPPESETVRHLEAAASTRSEPAMEELRAAFTGWTINRVTVAELQTLSTNLAVCGVIGLEALRYLKTGKPAPAGWVAKQNQTLDGMKPPCAEVMLAASRPVRILLTALATANR